MRIARPEGAIVQSTCVERIFQIARLFDHEFGKSGFRIHITLVRKNIDRTSPSRGLSGDKDVQSSSSDEKGERELSYILSEGLTLARQGSRLISFFKHEYNLQLTFLS